MRTERAGRISRHMLGFSPGHSLGRVPGHDHQPAIDQVAGWWTNRIFNDRELDHGILMLLLSVWIVLFHDALGTSTWWAEVFRIMPPTVWALLLGGIGVVRLLFSSARFGHDKKRLAAIALVSCFLFGFLSFLVGIVRYQMSVTPLFFWLSYQSAKSYLRLTVPYRSTAHHHQQPRPWADE